MSQHEKKVTAYHEAGHAIIGHFMENHDPPHKITIVARGMAGGYTRFLPEEETHYRTPAMFKDMLCAALGGHAAEELIFGQASTGPSDDIRKVTQIARSMVTRFGMSEKLGPRTFGRSEELVFLGREISETRDYSEKVAEEIDEEVRTIIEEAQERARRVLREHKPLLDKVANVLVEIETIEGDALNRLLTSDPNDPWPPSDMPRRDDPPAPKAADDAPRRPTFEPRPSPGLAWEGGSSSSSTTKSTIDPGT